MKILYVSDFDQLGSGYGTICANLSTQLVRHGHEVVVLGIEYKGQPHDYPFRVARGDWKTLFSQVEAIRQAQWPDVVIFSHDLPTHRQLTEWWAGKGTAQYVGLFPVEAGPLVEMSDWCGYIAKMDVPLVISEFGLNECRTAGLDKTQFLPVGIDHEFWHPLPESERAELRRDLGLEDRFVVITVAANHFRKNLSGAMQSVAEAVRQVPNLTYLVIAQPTPQSLGWNLKGLAERYNIADNVRVIHSRPDNGQLLRFYQAADAYLCTSHAEGLGLPILEAQACGVAVVSGDWTAMSELIAGGRGVPVEAEYEFVDVFGNNNRFFINTRQAGASLAALARDPQYRALVAGTGYRAAQSRTFERATEVLLEALGEPVSAGQTVLAAHP